ncbi:hypothetical protein D9758_010397 [Tetrapyrgos nigripes]|uniref:Uncharacterized protein n=1 Tax=Tetrapyrgos nigripes TaxID=182062 RepID=A0A8H5D160_9AGAR|nr:hypothetical protein D9758_010397 [Tetrapyrgos nigripes]
MQIFTGSPYYKRMMCHLPFLPLLLSATCTLISLMLDSGVSNTQRAFGLAFHYLLYGIYSVLFLISVVLYVKGDKREGTRRGRQLRITINILLFVLATIAVVLDSITEGTVLHSNSTKSIDIIPSVVFPFLLILSSMFADTLWMYRCLVVWNHRIKIMILPILASVSIYLYLLIMACIAASREHIHNSATKEIYFEVAASYLIIACLNLLICGMIAGRIAWILHLPGPKVQSSTRKYYSKVIAIVLESGLLYPIVLLTNAGIMLRHMPLFVGIGSGVGMLIQFAGIVPALIIVRINLEPVPEPNIPQVSLSQVHDSELGTSILISQTITTSTMQISYPDAHVAH